MADTTVTIGRTDDLRSGQIAGLYGRIHIGDELLIAAREPETLERLAEAAMEAARDLRIAIVAENEKRAANFLDSDDTSAMAHRFKEQKAEREAKRGAA